MRVVVDLQGAQAANARRGIGNYSLALADHLAAAPREHEIVVALNGAFADATDELAARFRSRGLRTDVWFPPADLRGAVVDDRWTSEAAEVVREEFLASVGADVVLVSSLFEGFGDPAITSVKRSRTTPTAVVLYDLIPLIRRSDYLVDPRMEAWYEDRLRHLRRADRLLAISGSTREEAVEWIGADPGRVIDIGAGAHARFVPGEPTDRDVRAARARAGLGRPHLLYTGGIDPRKNLDRLIEAFALLPTPLRTAHQLAIVCSVRPEERAHLEAVAAAAGLGPDEVVLTGFVPDDDLVVLTQSAAGAVFPSLHEGFGLPVLEAMKCGTPVVTSDRSSLPEVIGRPDAMFDPTSVDAIADRKSVV